MFESFVNSERCKTEEEFCYIKDGLRALLIQKDAKLRNRQISVLRRLRALLIQKDIKPEES